MREENHLRTSLCGGRGCDPRQLAKSKPVHLAKDEKNKLFEFRPEKRANRLGWGEASRFYKWSLEGIFWERADSEEVRYSTQSEKGKPVPEDLLRLIPPFVTDLGKGPQDISRAVLFQKAQTNTPFISKHNYEVFMKILQEQKKIDWVERIEDPREKKRLRYFFRIEPGLF